MGKTINKIYKYIDSYLESYIIDKLNSKIKKTVNKNIDEKIINKNNKNEVIINTNEMINNNDKLILNTDEKILNLIFTNDDIKEVNSSYRVFIDSISNAIVYIYNKNIDINDKQYIINTLYNILINSIMSSLELNIISKNNMYKQKYMLDNITQSLEIIYSNIINLSYITLDLDVNKKIMDIKDIFDKHINNKIKDSNNKILDFINKNLSIEDKVSDDIELIVKSCKYIINQQTIIYNELNNNKDFFDGENFLLNITKNAEVSDESYNNLNNYYNSSINNMEHCINIYNSWDNNAENNSFNLIKLTAHFERSIENSLYCIKYISKIIATMLTNIQIENNINTTDKDFIFNDSTSIVQNKFRFFSNTLESIYSFGL